MNVSPSVAATLSNDARKPIAHLSLVKAACLLQRKSLLSSAYWQRWSQLHKTLADKFHGVVDAVVDAMKHLPRASSLVENLNSRLRNYFFLRRQLAAPYLGLLQFFLNHRTFLRSKIMPLAGRISCACVTQNGPNLNHADLCHFCAKFRLSKLQHWRSLVQLDDCERDPQV